MEDQPHDYDRNGSSYDSGETIPKVLVDVLPSNDPDDKYPMVEVIVKVENQEPHTFKLYAYMFDTMAQLATPPTPPESFSEEVIIFENDQRSKREYAEGLIKKSYDLLAKQAHFGAQLYVAGIVDGKEGIDPDYKDAVANRLIEIALEAKEVREIDGQSNE